MTTNEQIIIDGMDVSRCEFSTIRGNELKCFAEDKDIHTCLKITEKTKCPIYRLKIQLQRKTAECEELQKLCQNQAKTINDLTGCVGLWEEFSEEESELAKNSSIADLVVLLREARSSLENKTVECEGYFKQRNNILEECVRYQEEIGKLQKSQFCVAYEKDCHKVCKQQNCAIKNSYRYKQALDEIEEIANEPCIADTQEDCKSCDGNCEHKDILGIIRKAKGADNHG